MDCHGRREIAIAEQKAHQNKIAKLLFVAQPRQSLEDSAFQGRALERVVRVPAVSEKCQKFAKFTLATRLNNALPLVL
jgi:hypothetical protein